MKRTGSELSLLPTICDSNSGGSAKKFGVSASTLISLQIYNFLMKKTEEDARIPSEWVDEFEAASRRPLATRLRYSFIHTYKPVLDDAPYRAFATMEEYRHWCERNLPSWLGYGRV